MTLPTLSRDALASWANPQVCNSVRMIPIIIGIKNEDLPFSFCFLTLISSPEQIWTADPYIISVVL